MALVELIKNCSEVVQYAKTEETKEILQNPTNETAIHFTQTIACHETEESTLTKYSFATEGIGLFTVAVVGIFANILSIAVLCEKNLKTKITSLLVTLAVFDTLFLLCCIPVFTISSVRGFVAYLNNCVYKDGMFRIYFYLPDMNKNVSCQKYIYIYIYIYI